MREFPGPTPWRTLLVFATGVKLYALILLYATFLTTPASIEEGGFLYRRDWQSESSRRSEIERSFWERLGPYDGQWYLDIARRGYRMLSGARQSDDQQGIAKRDGRAGNGAANPAGIEAGIESAKQGEARLPPGNYAFFPLLALVVAASDAVLGGRGGIGAIILGIAASAAGAACAGRMAGSTRGGRPGCARAGGMLVVLLLATYPPAIFQGVLYTEGPFLLLSTATVLVAMQGKALSAAALGALGGLCRPQGVLLCLPLLAALVVPRLRERAWGRALGALPAVAAPLGGFVAMALVSLDLTGSPLAFLQIQSSWGRGYEAGGVPGALASVASYRGPPADLLGLALGLGLLPVIWRRLPLPLSLLGTGMVVLPLATGSILSFGRFLSVSFPHFIALALVLEGRPRARGAALLVFASLQVLLARGLIAWRFVG